MTYLAFLVGGFAAFIASEILHTRINFQVAAGLISYSMVLIATEAVK